MYLSQELGISVYSLQLLGGPSRRNEIVLLQERRVYVSVFSLSPILSNFFLTAVNSYAFFLWCGWFFLS